MSTSDLDRFIDSYHAALDGIVQGDAEPMKRLFSKRDDVTLANPLGPPARGSAQVGQAMERAASNFRDGEDLRFERLAEHASEDLAFIFEVERVRMRIAGSDELSPVALRVTSVFRREEEGWRVEHRHADPILTPRSAETIIER
jgi:ketosteroid isomerase-like protein